MSVITLNVDEARRTLSSSDKNVFVINDKNVDIVRFALMAGFADIALDERSALRVMYQRPGETQVRAQTLTYYDTDGIRKLYDWELLSADLAKSGTLTVALCILRTDTEVEEWHTTPYQIRVLGSIHTDDSDEGDETITPTVAQRVAVLESVIHGMAGGAPVVVGSVSDMTDTGKLYVLTTNNNWYYHNGTTWVSGGTYGAVATDTTLTQSGIPADAKAVGDAIIQVTQTMNVDIAGSWNGDFTNGVITPADVSLSVFAACVPGVQYTISKTPTQRFSVFFTDQYPQIGLPIMEYRIIDQKTAASITAVAPEGAKYICAYVYNRNTDSGYGTKEEVMASVNIVAQSAVDMIARDEIKRIDEIEKTLYGRNITLKWEHGSIGLDGALQSDAKRIRTRSLITKSDAPTDIILSGSTYQFSVRYYDSNGGFLSSDTVWRSASLYDVFSQVENCEAIKIVSRLSANTTMTDTDMENVQSALSVSISSISDTVIPSSVRQAIYNLFAHAAYATTANVSNDIVTLQSWAEVE